MFNELVTKVSTSSLGDGILGDFFFLEFFNVVSLLLSKASQ